MRGFGIPWEMSSLLLEPKLLEPNPLTKRLCGGSVGQTCLTCRYTSRKRRRGDNSKRSRLITSSDFLIDGGVTAASWFSELAPK
jgi:hypothetical protein